MTLLYFNDKPCRIPSSWNEFTVRMMQDTLREHKENPDQWKNILYRLCTYTGFDFQELSNCKITDEQFETIAGLLEFEREALDTTALVIPNSIKFYKRLTGGDLFNSDTIRVPKSIDQEAAGKKVTFKEDVIMYWHENKDIVPVLHKAIAIYFQSEVMPGSKFAYDGDMVAKFEEMCLDCLFVEAFPTATFFLTKSISWILKNQKNSSVNHKKENLKVA